MKTKSSYCLRVFAVQGGFQVQVVGHNPEFCVYHTTSVKPTAALALASAQAYAIKHLDADKFFIDDYTKIKA